MKPNAEIAPPKPSRHIDAIDVLLREIDGLSLPPADPTESTAARSEAPATDHKLFDALHSSVFRSLVPTLHHN